MTKPLYRQRDYTYVVCGQEGEFYVILYDADDGTEAGYMMHNGKPGSSEDLKEVFNTREQANLQAASWGYTL